MRRYWEKFKGFLVASKLMIASLFVAALGVAFYVKIDSSVTCQSLSKFANDSEKVSYFKQKIKAINNEEVLRFNQFLTIKKELAFLQDMAIDWSLLGVDFDHASLRFDRRVHDKGNTIKFVQSISVLVGHCCMLKIPIFNKDVLSFTEIEKKYAELITKDGVYLSCKFDQGGGLKQYD